LLKTPTMQERTHKQKLNDQTNMTYIYFIAAIVLGPTLIKFVKRQIYLAKAAKYDRDYYNRMND